MSADYAAAMAAYKRTHPRARRRGSVGIIKSGAVQTVYHCVCGAQHTVATRNRGTTKHEHIFLHQHHDCILRFLEAK